MVLAERFEACGGPTLGFAGAATGRAGARAGAARRCWRGILMSTFGVADRYMIV